MKTELLNRQRQRPIERARLLKFCDRLTDRMPHSTARSWTLCLVSDRRMAKLNHQYRSKSGATDVLSFPDDPDDEIPACPDDLERELGDVVISIETAERQADEQGHSLWHELEVLSIHGYLHLSGYDHETDNGEMMRLQGQLVRELCEEVR